MRMTLQVQRCLLKIRLLKMRDIRLKETEWGKNVITMQKALAACNIFCKKQEATITG